ncbi:MAG: Tryptophan--tRNA ligase 2 [Microgenomates bacterium OLB22]|nr:MAG: Tryptophan--tRNA ligase 2 [Microgenomates bacterium OLB22]
MGKQVVLTGMRTTGALHLGHYVGALKQWLEIQQTGQYECYFLLADIQALTTHADNPSALRQSVKDVTLDWLAVGLDPRLKNVHFVLQSQVPERAELSILLDMIATNAEVLDNPTLKAELQDLQVRKTASSGFMRYPVDQVADIHMVDPMEAGSTLLVPVGADQESHLELARDIARRFNRVYSPTKAVLTPCRTLVGDIGRLVGTDGDAKMSKSKGNTIDLRDDADTVARKIKGMAAGPNRGANEPGKPDENPVFIYLRAFDPDQIGLADLEQQYRERGVPNSALKGRLTTVLNDFLDPSRARRRELAGTDISQILVDGSDAAREACTPVITTVKEAMAVSLPYKF